MAYIKIENIVKNPNQMRKTDRKKFKRRLHASIEKYGITQPIIVRKIGRKYVIISGHQRYDEARSSGITKLKVGEEIVIRQKVIPEMVEHYIENTLRTKLFTIEEAEGLLKLLKDRFNHNVDYFLNNLLLNSDEEIEQFLKVLGVPILRAKKLLTVTQLDVKTKRRLIKRDIGLNRSYVLTKTNNISLRLKLIKRAVKEKLNDIDMERIIERS